MRRPPARAAIAAVLALLSAGLPAACGGDGNGGSADQDRWSLMEDHNALIRGTADQRERTLREMKTLGVDTLRVQLKWNEVAPSPLAHRRPGFDARDPGAYPGFGPYDDLARRAKSHGFRVLFVLAPDAPVWATEGQRGRPPGRVNLRPQPREFASFAEAAAKRYSGRFQDVPEVGWFSVWNEPNHSLFLKPLVEAPVIYRRLVEAALPALREHGAGDVRVLVGETAPAGRAGVSLGPAEFMRGWLCLDDSFRAVKAGECAQIGEVDADGFAHHPYGPIDVVPPGRDIVNLLAIRRLATYVDSAARAGRLPAELPIYNTEFGLQSNPPDPTVSTTPARQAALLNEKEEFSYRYPRLRSYAQYLLYDDPPRPGATEGEIWSGFQTGLRFADGRAKPSWSAYRLPIVVHAATGGGVRIWGRVRPGSGKRSAQFERRVGRAFEPIGDRVDTDEQGYFEVTLPAVAAYRFRAYDAGGRYFASSRVALPLPLPAG